MKKSLLFALILTAIIFPWGGKVSAQDLNLTLDELLNIHLASVADQEDLLLTEGYDFEESSKEDIMGSETVAFYYSFKVKKANRNQLSSMIVIRGKKSTSRELTVTSFIVFDSETYVKMKKRVTEMGFTYTGSPSVKAERNEHHYVKGNIEMVFYTENGKAGYLYGVQILEIL